MTAAAIVVAGVDGAHHTVALEPGEPWVVAAQRWQASRGEADPLHPEDLAADPPRFSVSTTWQVSLRPAASGDLRDLVRWRQHEHVQKWWAGEGPATEERIRAQYLPEIMGESATRLWIIEANGRSVGFLQDYLLRDYPDYAVLTPDPGAIGVDYAIGEASWVGRGVGPTALWRWLEATRVTRPDVSTAFAAPDHRNTASLRMLEKVGFRQGIWFDAPQPDGSMATVVGCDLRFADLWGDPSLR